MQRVKAFPAHQPIQPISHPRAPSRPVIVGVWKSPRNPLAINYGRATVALMDQSQPPNLTGKEEAFAQAYVRTGNQSAAYRAAYDANGMKWTTLYAEANRVFNRPDVQARIQQLQSEAAARSAIPPLIERIKELREIESADVNDIISLRWVNCRYCRGDDHNYQWSDETEYARACDAARASKPPKPMPDCLGGFGFNPWGDPVSDCPRCWGVGERVPWIADTSKLTGPSRRLYKGVKIKGNGDIELLLHDQMQARDMLNRIQAAYKDGVPVGTAGGDKAVKDAQDPAITKEERQRRYLRVMSST